MEIMTKKRMMLSPGTIHPALAHEIADCLAIPVSKGEIRRFASGEIYFRAEEIGARRRRVRRADALRARERGDHGAADHDRRDEARVGASASPRSSRTTATRGRTRRPSRARPISAKLVADLLSTAGADRVVSVDLHSGQIQGFFDAPFDHLTALPILSDYIKDTLGLHGRRPGRRGARRRSHQDRREAPRVPARRPGVPLQAALAATRRTRSRR